ncbi:kinase-like domain-containing protein [Xylariaceae sp. FL0594]|nr:kinase-like domain-containing protein [Xylariaceae sp. FL0594]
MALGSFFFPALITLPDSLTTRSPWRFAKKGQIFIEKDGDFVFDHTSTLRPVSAYLSPTIRIPGDKDWPLADPEFTRAPDPLPSTAYLKRPSLLYYENSSNNSDYACPKKTPPSQYRAIPGLYCQGRKDKGACLRQVLYNPLADVRGWDAFDRSCCLHGIQAGVSHMHELGLVHNDLNPSNIMMNGDDPVIIDFDSCKREGEKLGSKVGSYGWTLDGDDYAKRENDLYSLQKIREALMEDSTKC